LITGGLGPGKFKNMTVQNILTVMKPESVTN
jgi:hypothetical protein